MPKKTYLILIIEDCYKAYNLMCDLILHIEKVHIDFKVTIDTTLSPCLPLSRVLPFSCQMNRRHMVEEYRCPFVDCAKSYRHLNAIKFRSNDGPKKVSSSEKPYACPIPGCAKRYKNPNGIKYHSKNGHKNDGLINVNFTCHACGKMFKFDRTLKKHSSRCFSQTVPQGDDRILSPETTRRG